VLGHEAGDEVVDLPLPLGDRHAAILGEYKAKSRATLILLRNRPDLDTYVRGAKSVFIGFSRLREFRLRILFAEVGCVPLLPGDHRMVVRG